MPEQRLRLHQPDERFGAGFAAIRAELDIPAAFPDDVLSEAEQSAARGPVLPPGASGPIVDRRDLPLVTIDPLGSRDLDQAFGAEELADGYRVHYAIADVAAFVAPGGAIDREALLRGVTLYAPDGRSSLHPEVLSEGIASLLPDEERQALLWTIDLDADGELRRASLARSLVRSREMLTYHDAQERIDGGHHDLLQRLRTIGLLRQEREAARGAVSLDLPAQEVVRHGDHYELIIDETLPVEGWNAQISLLTGIAAAQMMSDAGVGILRTLPEADEQTLATVRRAARSLDITWPEGMSYADRVRDLDSNVRDEAVLLRQAARALRGAGYVAFTEPLDRYPTHGAIASVYAHVTAPLRRVCDRFANEILLAHSADREPAGWAVEALDELPSVMGRARQRDSALERATIDLAETVVLSDRVGDTFDVLVIDVDDERAQIRLAEPPVVTSVPRGPLSLGDHRPMKLVEADVVARRLRFEPEP